ncbi:hypothetical protein Micbo1qcDRAFT_160270 [Microdochium bolleyi]|uniref:Uncharacterized protein n=1 Tax=Microdochium bolleyi TaxID=196109 RepID=A0A136J5P9_9PEZI|nr:hypothetical protein Micbo1qcDRAFT_160270 [Microdochium bolleyi]
MKLDLTVVLTTSILKVFLLRYQIIRAAGPNLCASACPAAISHRPSETSQLGAAFSS